MIKRTSKRFFVLFFILISNFVFGNTVRPRLTVIFVIDQFAHAYINKMRSKLTGGLALLLEKGVFYNNAYYPHAMPATATGHTALATGVYPKDHGVVGNKWFDATGKTVRFANVGKDEKAAVFACDGIKTLDFGRSSKRLMVPGISDMFMLNPALKEKNYVYAISLKDRAAIATAGKLGKAIWFDCKGACFTSSKAYFDVLPEWLIAFNKEKKIKDLKTIKWEPVHKLDSSFYVFKDAFDYSFSSGKQMIGKDIKIYDSKNESPYKGFAFTPYSNDVLCHLAQTCIENVLLKDKSNRLILWVSLSSLDKLGHLFGPHSAENIDTIYHIDRRIKRFMKNIEKKVKKDEILFVLTSDHGVTPIPEYLQSKGLKGAIRIDDKKLLAGLNSLADSKFGLQRLFLAIKNNNIFINKKLFNTLYNMKKQNLRAVVIAFLKKYPGIKNAWSYNQLQNKVFDSGALENYYKNQLYPSRSGEFIVQVNPFCFISNYKAGTSHATPYEYDTHVPLIMYQKGAFEEKEISDKVSMLQFANTLSTILKIPKSPASTFNVLPGLFKMQN